MSNTATVMSLKEIFEKARVLGVDPFEVVSVVRVADILIHLCEIEDERIFKNRELLKKLIEVEANVSKFKERLNIMALAKMDNFIITGK